MKHLHNKPGKQQRWHNASPMHTSIGNLCIAEYTCVQFTREDDYINKRPEDIRMQGQ